jgi:hypothetical protein
MNIIGAFNAIARSDKSRPKRLLLQVLKTRERIRRHPKKKADFALRVLVKFISLAEPAGNDCRENKVRSLKLSAVPL